MEDHKTLSKRFSEIKSELDEAEESLKKLLGHVKSDWLGLPPEYQKSHAISSCKILYPQKSAVKRSRDSPESSEENASEDELLSEKVAVRSAIITKVGSTKSRRDLILKQNSNTNIRSRNRRMFGMVQSTLQKFQDEAVKRQSQDLKRIKVLQKVEAAEEEEKQLIEKQKIELYSKQREKKLELDCIQKMMELTESFEIWENNQKHLMNYSVTETEPKICFLPVSHTSKSKEHLKRSKVKIQEIMQKQKEVIQEELAKINESYQLQLAVPISEVTTSLLQNDSHNTLEQETHAAVTEQEYIEENINLYLSENELLISD